MTAIQAGTQAVEPVVGAVITLLSRGRLHESDRSRDRCFLGDKVEHNRPRTDKIAVHLNDGPIRAQRNSIRWLVQLPGDHQLSP